MFPNHKNSNKAFTLIELLVVIAIIGVLAAVVLASLNSARAKARDAQRLSDLKQIQTALEMYYNEYGYYPKRVQAHTETDPGACGGTLSWCSSADSLKIDLVSYLKLPLKNDAGFNKNYYYDSNPGDNNQSYGLMIELESSSNSPKEWGDGGFYASHYEVGEQPVYCLQKYGTGASGNWWTGSGGLVCNGGN